MKVTNVVLQVCLVLLPSHLVDPDRRVLVELIETPSQQVFIDVMQQGGES
jgi:hypothetical protein